MLLVTSHAEPTTIKYNYYKCFIVKIIIWFSSRTYIFNSYVILKISFDENDKKNKKNKYSSFITLCYTCGFYYFTC